MRPHQIFASMPAADTETFFSKLSEQSPALFGQLVQAAAAAFKSRPQFLMKQPFGRRAASVRRALARVSSDALAEETLAVYFLECRKDILIEWLDRIGLAHEEGVLQEGGPPEPRAAELEAHVKAFCEHDEDVDRKLLLAAFAAQASIDWPKLDALIDGSSAGIDG